MGEAKRRADANKLTALRALQGCDVAAYKAARMIAEEWLKTDTNFTIKMRGMLDGVIRIIDTATEIYAKKGGAECSRGCFFCCRQMVTMSPAELFVLAYTIIEKYKDDQEGYISFITRLNTFVTLPVEAKALAGKWCPLLVNNECSVYDKRPISCRSHLSISRQKCETTDMFGGNVPYIGNSKVVGISARMALDYVFLHQYNLRIEPVELTHGLLIVLQDFQGTFEAWKSGRQDVFIDAEGHEEDKVGFTYTELTLKAGSALYDGTINTDKPV